jgi:hypothetical protein
MIEIRTESEFEGVLSKPRAIVFIHGEWAGPSVEALERFERWLAENGDSVAKFTPDVYCVCLPPTTHDFLTQWIDGNPLLQLRNSNGQAIHLGCSGAAAWVVSGAVVRCAKGIRNLSFEDLDRLTAEALGEAGG